MLLIGFTLTLACVTSSAKLECPVSSHGNVGHCSCSSLAEVRCHGLQSVPKIDFAMAAALWNNGTFFRGIYLSRQNIRSLPRAAFSSLPVSRIVLNFNHIGDDIDRETFVDPVETVNEHLQRAVPSNETSHMTTLQRERHLESSASLAGLTLTELYMGACKIKILPVLLFRRLASLRKLHLWANEIEILPATLLRYNSRLVELSLWGNRIDQLDARVFEGLRLLRHLDLDRNYLTSLSASAVAHLTKLTRLSLNGNRIHALSQDLFSEINSLRSLSLDSNGLGFVYGRTLRTLMINRRTLRTLTKLNSLSLRRNELNILADEMFATLTRLSELRLDYNHIEHVWSQTFSGLRSLVRLSMTSNRLSHVPDGAFRESMKLKHVFLSDNQLTSLGRCAANGELLSKLVLNGNPMECDCGIAWMQRIVQQGAFVSGTCQSSTKENKTSQASIRMMAESFGSECTDSMSTGAC